MIWHVVKWIFAAKIFKFLKKSVLGVLTFPRQKSILIEKSLVQVELNSLCISLLSHESIWKHIKNVSMLLFDEWGTKTNLSSIFKKDKVANVC